MTFCLGVACTLSKKYSHLYLLQLFAYGTVTITLAYTLFFFNWDFYLATNMVSSLLAVLAYWEVNRKLEKRNVYWIWPVSFAILTIPLWPVTILIKSYMSPALVSLFFAFDLGYAIRCKNPFIFVWTSFGAFALALDVLKLMIPSRTEIIAILSGLELWSGGLQSVALLVVVVWTPVMAWLAPKLKVFLPNMNLKPAFVTAGDNKEEASTEHADVVHFPGLPVGDMSGIQQATEDMDLLEPLLMSATRMISLSNKPFLNCEDLRDYLDLDEEQIEAFLQKYEIKKFRLLEDNDQWVVRRQDVENIPDNNGIRTLRSPDK